MSDHHFIIVASGPSARGFVPPSDCKVIAVNGAVDWLERADYFFSLDPSAENLQRVKNRWQDVEKGKIVSYKKDVAPVGKFLKSVGDGTVPEKAKIVCFHGKPRPWQVILNK